jgi:Fur family peroxide stress response transcriptional regulator
MANKTVIKILTDNGLKVTPQRTAVLEVIMDLNNHPTADEIVQYLRISYPHIPIGTVYKILDKFFKLGIIDKVKTDNDLIRYDAVKTRHHHLYSTDKDSILDFYDEDLDNILTEYFKKKNIPGFIVQDYKLQIIGKEINNT